MHAHAVGVYPTPAPATPHVAVGIAANAVREAGLKVCKYLAPARRHAVFDNIEDDDICRIVRSISRTGINDIDLAEIGREANTVWSTHRPFSGYRYFAGLAIDAIDPGGQFEFSFVTFVGAEDAVTRIG